MLFRSKNGTGALGGSINIMNLPRWNDSTFIRAFAQIGSYDTYTGAASRNSKCTGHQPSRARIEQLYCTSYSVTSPTKQIPVVSQAKTDAVICYCITSNCVTRYCVACYCATIS